MTQTTILRLLDGTAAEMVRGSDVPARGIAYDSRSVREGDVFFCIRGFAADGHDFASRAAKRGAAALVVQRPLDDVALPQVLVGDTRSALAIAADRFWNSPSKDLDVVGVTGTNGKTTTTYLLDSILRAAGRTTGLVGTVETRVAEETEVAGRTTPESADVQALLARMRDVGVTAVSMEVSSHAIDLHRVDRMRFAVAGFTNLSQDHLDYHHTFEEYSSVKRRLFTEFDVGVRVVDIDDPFGAVMALELGVEMTVGRAEDADVRAADERPDAYGTSFVLVTPGGTAPIRLPITGAYNVSNALLAAGCALALGIDVDRVVEGLESAPQVPGRLERIEMGQPFSVVVDYAHTPDSLEKAIHAVREGATGRAIVVFGCGGDRDSEKRPLMGRAAGIAADHVIVTSDNPRSEDPVGIILQIEDGLREVAASWQTVVDRREAIISALSQAAPGDVVLIAGKGHEDYQIFADRTVHFDDREVAREELSRLCSG